MRFFLSKKQRNQKDENAHPNENGEVITDKPDDKLSNTVYSIEYGTGFPIDLIYAVLKKDYSNRGYNDALVCPDMSYRDINLSVIRNELEVYFRQLTVKYEDMLRDIDYKIISRTEAGLMSIVELLKSKREICIKHVEELQKMKQDFDKEEPYMTGNLKSYEAGFTRGITSLSLKSLNTDIL
ncbi:MAG: hypothetical protein LBG92_06380 [Prevotellaceae bacterium]|jgi:hypothetical protein|nr:hypothetical protein [Prevotellaceae bacterium]